MSVTDSVLQYCWRLIYGLCSEPAQIYYVGVANLPSQGNNLYAQRLCVIGSAAWYLFTWHGSSEVICGECCHLAIVKCGPECSVRVYVYGIVYELDIVPGN